MNYLWPLVPFSRVLTERREVPTAGDLASGDVRIIAKIGFDDGEIQLRTGGSTRTGMILVRPGDLVLSGINAVRGAIAIYDPTAAKPIAATIHYGAYIPKYGEIEVRYIWWLLRSNIFRRILRDYLPRGIKTELKAKRLLSIQIPLPPIGEQQRLVARIEQLINGIRNVQNLRRDASSESNKLFSRVLAKAFTQYRDKARPIGDTFKVTTGGTPSRNNPAYWNGDIKWVSSGEVAFCRIADTIEKITQLGLQHSNAKTYPPGAVLLAMIGQGKTRGQCAILDCYASTNQNVAGIHVYETNHDPEYVYWWLYSRYQESRLSETGTAQPALSAERVKEMLIPLPSPVEQRRISSELRALHAKISGLFKMQTEVSDKLNVLRRRIVDDVLMKELISDTLRVDGPSRISTRLPTLTDFIDS